MSMLTPFAYNGHEVRTLAVNGEPAVVTADVLAVLDLSRSSAALLDDDEKGVHTVDTPGGPQQIAYVTEPGLYSLILRSRKPEAKPFKRWITHDVLPQIRRTGAYAVEHQIPQTYADALRAYADEVDARQAAEARSAELEPKADAYDEFMDADGTYSIGAVAKMLGRGQNRLFDELRARRVLISKGAMRNTPYQQYAHHFRVHAQTFEKRDGQTGTSYTTKVRPSGVEFIAKRLGQPLLTEVSA